jgi:hypothetical protein
LEKLTGVKDKESLNSDDHQFHQYQQNQQSPLIFFFFFNNVIYFIQMLATINTPKVQAPFGVSLLHLVLIIQGYNQNYMSLDFWRVNCSKHLNKIYYVVKKK